MPRKYSSFLAIILCLSITLHASASEGIDQSFSEARTLFLTKEYDQAEAAFLRIIQHDQEHARTYAYLGMIYQKKEEYQQARTYLQKALEIDPDLKVARMTMDYLEKKITQEKKQAEARKARVLQKKKKQQPKKRLLEKKDYIEVIEDDFDDYTIYRVIGNVLGTERTGSGLFAGLVTPETIELNVQRFEKNGATSYGLFVEYGGALGADSWLFIQPGESLVLLVDGERCGFSRTTYENNINKHGNVWEWALYRTTPEIIRKIAFAKEVRVKIIGDNYHLERYCRRCNFHKFRQFMYDYIDENISVTGSNQATDYKARFDIPTLLKMNIREVRQALGKPADEFVPTKQQWDLFEDDMTGTIDYVKGTTRIQIDYVKNGRIKHIFISDETPGRTKEAIAKLGNIDLDSEEYNSRVQHWLNHELAKQENKSQIAGIEVSR